MTLKWTCETCGYTFETEPTRHDPAWCECGDAFVDHEEHYVRHNEYATPL